MVTISKILFKLDIYLTNLAQWVRDSRLELGNKLFKVTQTYKRSICIKKVDNFEKC